MVNPRVVFETNVFARAIINPKGVNSRLVHSIDRFVPVASPAIVEEVVEVLSRSDLLRSKAIRQIDADKLVALLQRAPLVTPQVKLTVCRDPDDDKFLEAAVAASAKFVVTGDKDLRDIGQFEGVKIRYPQEFLDALEQE